jgi:uncharacterized MAPEG superfamily protein
MSATAIALIGYAAWTMLLVGGIGAIRVAAVLGGRPEGNRFAVDGSDMSPFAQRLCRAHANCYENLPVFAALALTALATGHTAVTDPLALWALAARVGQSVTHLGSVSPMAINLRFAFYGVQLVIQLLWIIGLLGAAG